MHPSYCHERSRIGRASNSSALRQNCHVLDVKSLLSVNVKSISELVSDLNVMRCPFPLSERKEVIFRRSARAAPRVGMKGLLHEAQETNVFYGESTATRARISVHIHRESSPKDPRAPANSEALEGFLGLLCFASHAEVPSRSRIYKIFAKTDAISAKLEEWT